MSITGAGRRRWLSFGRLPGKEDQRTEQMPELKFTRQLYPSAAKEHLGRAIQLDLDSRYFESHYFAGVAVECVLRALGARDGDSFDSSHSIAYWAKKADLLPKGDGEKQDEFRARLNELDSRWRANHRYLPENKLVIWLNDRKLDRTVKGDRLKFNSKRMIDLANNVVSLGVIRWNQRTSGTS